LKKWRKENKEKGGHRNFAEKLVESNAGALKANLRKGSQKNPLEVVVY